MRLIFTIFTLLLSSLNLPAQKITGIWRGYFSSSSAVYGENARKETYKYEVQIQQLSNNGLKGVTFSYKTTVFYGKAELQGIYTPGSKSLILKEVKLVDKKIADNSEPCLMTCYLDYSKIGKLEILEGNFISINMKDKTDCGSGNVYLEKVPTSDFQKEDFLLNNKEKAKRAKEEALAKTAIPPSTKSTEKPFVNSRGPGKLSPGARDNLITKPIPLKPGNPAPKTTAGAASKTLTATEVKPKPNTLPKANSSANSQPRPAAKNDKPNKPVQAPADRIPEPAVNSKKEENFQPEQKDNLPGKIPIPKVLLERENNLVKTIVTSEENILVELYDNGTIDNDTISVYHNNQLVISNSKLTLSPITVKIKASRTDSRHEMIVVAENLGDIPPNTALMVIKAGRERYEIFLASNEQRNAKVVINYIPKD